MNATAGQRKHIISSLPSKQTLHVLYNKFVFDENVYRNSELIHVLVDRSHDIHISNRPRWLKKNVTHIVIVQCGSYAFLQCTDASTISEDVINTHSVKF